MKIVSYEESRQILRNLRRKETMKKYAKRLRDADQEERARILVQIDREVEEWLERQIITGS